MNGGRSRVALGSRGLTVSIRDKRIGFLGGGNIGEALIRGLTKTGLVPVEHLLVADVRADRLEELRRLYGVLVAADNVTLVRRADVVILAVKPQILREVLEEIAPATPGKLLDLRGGRRVHRGDPAGTCPPAPG